MASSSQAREGADGGAALDWDAPHLRLARLFKRFLMLNTGYPHFSARYARKHIERSSTLPSELREYRARPARYLRLALITLSLLFGARTLALPLFAFSELDHLRLDRNVKFLARDTYKFNCLISNCSKFARLDEVAPYTRLHLGQTLNALPHLSICHNLLSQLLEPTQFISYLGLLLATASGFAAVLSGAWLPFLQLIYPTSNLVLMFIVAPRVTRRVVQDRALAILDELRASAANFRRSLHARTQARALDQQAAACNHLASDHKALSADDADKDANAYAHETPHFLLRHQVFQAENERESPLAPLEAHLWDERRAAYADDCVSIMRSPWWHRRATRLWALASLVQVLLLMVMPLLIAFLYPFERLFASFQLVGARMRQLNCAIWLDYENPGAQLNLEPSRLFDLEHYAYTPNVPLILLLYVWLLYPLVCLALFFTTYYATICELTFWLFELIRQLTQCIEIVRQVNLGGRLSGMREQCATSTSKPRAPLQLSQLRADFAPLVQFNFAPLECKHLGATWSRLEAARALEQRALRAMAEHQLDAEIVVELLEKLLVSVRIFTEQVGHNALTMTALVAFIHVYIYGFILASIWYLRMVDGFVFWPVCLVACSWTTANFLILLASNFHAKAKVLHALIWSLLAATCECSELRMRHLRSLWLKQALALDMDGGLALRAFKVRITYVRIIQLIIGACTLSVFTLRL